MITYKPTVFESDVFAIQVVSKGAFVDTGTGAPGKAYAVEAITLRLNWFALNEWLSSEVLNTRECYADGPEGDEEWKAHQAKYRENRMAFEDKIICDLGLDSKKGGITIKRVFTEVFAVVYIWEMCGARTEEEATE